ncbi:exosortase/archaeosortase family protein [Cerasicoccus arenae]|nr:exosortase/archaeosortase family protein [Cerasicoccus arenae]MBK1858490.1 exosortase/archaeosortase family protein [Cerasicoccus arenae]
MTSAQHRLAWISAALLSFAGAWLFQFYGNNVRSYFNTESLFAWWGLQWFNPRSQTEYGPIILLTSIGLTIWNWRRTPEDSSEPCPRAAVLLIMAGLALHAGGLIVEQARISIVGLLVFINGIAWLAGGRRAGRASAFPLLFLLFALPLEFLFDEFGFYLRLAVIQSSTTLAHLVGIGVFRNGTHLISPDGSFNYDVEPACSGIRSLVALTALTLLVGYCCFRTWWRRGFLLAVAFPFAYLGNVARIFTIILAAEWFGQEAGMVVHEWFGFLVFVIVLGLALATVSALEKWIPEKPLAVRQTSQKPLTSTRALGLTLVVGLGSIALCAAFAAKVENLGRSAEAGVRLTADGEQPQPLPNLLGPGLEWAGKVAPISEIERTVLPPDTGFSRSNYIHLDGGGELVYFSIVLCGKGRGAIHRPELCLVGQGWRIERKSLHDFAIPGMPDGLEATVLEIERTVQTEDGEVVIPGLFAYWFVGRDRVAATNIERMAWFAWDRLTRLQSHRWAYLFAQTDCPDGREAGLARLQSVIGEVVPVVQTAGFPSAE